MKDLANLRHGKTRRHMNENVQGKDYFVTCTLQIRIISN